MELKKENDKPKTPPKNNDAVFELIPGKTEKKPDNKPSFSMGFLTGFFVVGFLAIGFSISFFAAESISIDSPSAAVKEPIETPLTTPLIASESIKNPITAEEAKIIAETFINENLMPAGTEITIKEIWEQNGLYKIVVNNGGSADIDTYMTKDGKMFFPQAIDVEKTNSTKKDGAQSNSAAKPDTNPVKNDKPTVELFVMSHCPYGTQIEKGILPAVDALGNKINFKVKFTDYAMHGEKELTEELNQYCIQTNEPIKYNNYLKCFIESAGGDSATCLTKTYINKTTLASCVTATDKMFKVTANFSDKTTWKGNFPTFNIYKEDNTKYGVQGSPTLVINGTTVQSGRDSASLLKTICSAFTTPPEECETVLPATQPAPGFGTAVSTGTNNAACGN